MSYTVYARGIKHKFIDKNGTKRKGWIYPVPWSAISFIDYPRFLPGYEANNADRKNKIRESGIIIFIQNPDEKQNGHFSP